MLKWYRQDAPWNFFSPRYLKSSDTVITIIPLQLCINSSLSTHTLPMYRTYHGMYSYPCISDISDYLQDREVLEVTLRPCIRCSASYAIIPSAPTNSTPCSSCCPQAQHIGYFGANVVAIAIMSLPYAMSLFFRIGSFALDCNMIPPEKGHSSVHTR